MSQQSILGIVLLIVGVGLLVFGMQASHSITDQVSHTFTGKFTDSTTWYILGGIASGAVGLVMLAAGGRGKNA